MAEKSQSSRAEKTFEKNSNLDIDRTRKKG